MTQTRAHLLGSITAALLVFAGVVGVTFNAHAGTIRDGKSFGIGINGGYGGGNGVSFKTFLGRTFALQAYAGGHGKDWSPHVGADLLYEGNVFAGGRLLDVAWNIGGGAATTINSGAHLWIHGVGGIELLLKRLPIDIVLEVRPTFGFRKGDGVGGGGGAHVRWWF